MPIAIKVALAILHTLQASQSVLTNARVDNHTDNMTFLTSWKKLGSKNRQLNGVFKRLFSLTLDINVHLSLQYICSQPGLSTFASDVRSRLHALPRGVRNSREAFRSTHLGSYVFRFERPARCHAADSHLDTLHLYLVESTCSPKISIVMKTCACFLPSSSLFPS